jgi:hypothetical protein
MEFTRSSNSSGHRSARGAFLLLAGWLALCGYACAGEDAFVFAEKVSAPPYDAITIAAPLRDTTVFDREGNVEVRIFLTPSANLRAGDRVIVWLDGQRFERDMAGHFMIHAVPDGRHRLKASVIDGQGHVVVVSDLVEFVMSRNFSDRR